MSESASSLRPIPRFGRNFPDRTQPLTRIGEGEIGGKASGLAVIQRALETEFERAAFPWAAVAIPSLAVVATEVFEAFMQRNGLWEVARSDRPDDRLAHAFQRAEMPAEVLGDLRSVVAQVRTPLAVRSSSLLEDALFRPFAGVYATKMIPNNQPDPDERFRRLVEAVKFVWASTCFKAAKSYIRATDKTLDDERMAVIIQEVVGARYGGRFYPTISGVARSYNFYPSGRARPEEGVVSLALGLGKTIVDGGVCWSYSPAHPKAPPPFGSVREQLKQTQLDFWAVNMGKPPEYNPIAETEYLVKADLAAADYDATLEYLASTYDARSDRLVPGTGPRGTRVLNFAPLLVSCRLALNDLVRELLRVGEKALGTDVEIELAAVLPGRGSDRVRVGFLQVRPMLAPGQRVEVAEEELERPDLLLASRAAMGSGCCEEIRDVVYVKPDSFDAQYTRQMAAELDDLNAALLAEGRPYLLIGIGRWGSSDPWLGIPVEWGTICGAKVIVEATLPRMNVEPSQGSHFFHNISSFGVSYFTVSHTDPRGIDWAWLEARPALRELQWARHVRLERPLLVKVDGWTGRGGVWRPAE